VTEKHYAPFVERDGSSTLEMYARMAWEDSVVDAADISRNALGVEASSAQVN